MSFTFFIYFQYTSGIKRHYFLLINLYYLTHEISYTVCIDSMCNTNSHTILRVFSLCMFVCLNQNFDKGEVSNLKESFKKWSDQIFQLHSYKITPVGRRQSDGNIFFVKIGFPSWFVPENWKTRIFLIPKKNIFNTITVQDLNLVFFLFFFVLRVYHRKNYNFQTKRSNKQKFPEKQRSVVFTIFENMKKANTLFWRYSNKVCDLLWFLHKIEKKQPTRMNLNQQFISKNKTLSA
jgi:hypothetical protein